MSLEGKMTAAEYRAKLTQGKRSKFGNIPTIYNGVKYDSKRESEQAARIDLLVKGGYIVKVERQVPFPLVVNDIHIADYVADFVVTWNNGEIDVIDAKGYPNQTYPMKARLMKAIHGIEIVET